MGGDPEATQRRDHERGRSLRPLGGFSRKLATLLLGATLASCNSAGAVSGPSLTPPPEPAQESRPISSIAARPAELSGFYRGLERLERHRGGPLRIVQLGDSHTAGDFLTERLRELFQARFGNAGRGTMAVGLPYIGVRQVAVHIAQTGKWEYHNSLTRPDEGPYGITGFKASSRSAGASLTLQSLDPAGFDRVEIEVLYHDNGGFLDIEVDGKRERRLLTSGTTRLARVILDVPQGSRELRLVAADRRPVELLSWTIERRTSGIVFDSLGVSSATISLASHWSPEYVVNELRHLSPALVILAYGTNEGFQEGFDPDKYRQTVADTLSLVRRGAPGAAILVVGPPDAQRLTSACGGRPGAGAQASCLANPNPNRAYSCEWSTPEPLAEVREIERRQAGAAGAVFWDWSVIMGGACAMHQWVVADPPLARGDHVHMTAAGYNRTAEALFHDLMDAYAAHHGAEFHRPPPRRSRP